MRLLRNRGATLIPAAIFCCLTAWGQTTPNQTGTPAQPPATTDQSKEPAPNGQPTNPAPAPAPTPDNVFSTTAVRAGGIDFSGMVDGYYSWNDNHSTAGFNDLYNFDDRTNQADLSLLKLTVNKDPAPVGFRLDLGYGRTMTLVHANGTDPDFMRYVEQAYISVKPKDMKGFEIDFGQFVTSAGAEVIESKDNWNYSRSLLFALAIPYYHFGIRTSQPIGSSFTIGVQVVDGWNAVIDNHGNNMKTVGITAALTRKKYTWSNNYYAGTQYTGVGAVSRARNLFDTTLLLTPNDKLNAYLNFDYGAQNHPVAGSAHWIGFAGALHYQATSRLAFSPRAEYYDDPSGFTTGVRQKLHEVTLTGEYKLLSGLLARAEFRHDGSNVNYFDRGNILGATKAQSTITVAMIAFFPVKHQ